MAKSFLDELFGLEGQVAVVIGGTGVLGGALAEGIAKAGATVVVAGSHAERGADRVKAIEAAGGRAIYLPVDVSHRKSIEELLAQTLAKYQRVDMLVNCAGVNSASEYLEVSDEDWQRVIDIVKPVAQDRDIVFSVECGTVPEAISSFEHLSKLL